ncbi:TPA: glycosyhydrolase, partial [Enterococcus faecium]|nr:glycosyhydrolase [Enterococcus faecium]HBM8943356.1 glycosyhydrolase [Enterococcus faecium]
MKKFLVGILFTMGLVLLSPSVSAESSISMYRMYNPNSGEHLYTRSVGERDNLKRYGWHYEGVAWQAPTSGTPVYRLYNRYNGEHF